MSEFVGAVISSVFFGTALGMMALGFTLSYTVSKVFNFAVGQFAILGALLAIKLNFGGSAIVSDLVAILISTALGAIVYLLALRWPEKHGADPLTLVIITFGVGLIVEQLVTREWGSYSFTAPSIVNGGFNLVGNEVPWQGVIFLVVAAATVLGLALLQRKTIAGKQILALGANREAARFYGINDTAMVSIAWALSFMVLAIAGTLFMPLTGVSISTDITYGIEAFAAAVVGGLGNPGGAMAGGLIVGFVSTLAGTYLNPNIMDLLAFAMLFLFLVFKPSGLTGSAVEILGPRA
ncbi:MAG: branched-chain amino acid ABC transporter permease [Actinomycetota bacterium]|nr:branched-chain amino acid ABC transporter permease [Actinomycetota bacterium]